MDSYIVENGLRRVRPYYFEFRTTFKPRWAAKTAAQVLTSELGQNESVVSAGIDRGSIYVQKNTGKASGPLVLRHSSVKTHILRPHDVIFNLQHMHEKSVLWEGKNVGGGGFCGSDIQKSRLEGKGVCVLFKNSEYLVVSKPGGVPTHPSGIYRKNTMSEIVQSELDGKVWPCHRLDKGTLGVLVLARNTGACSRMMGILREKDDLTKKHYVARVKGRFPDGISTYTCPVFTVNSSGNGYINVPNASRVSARSTTEFDILRYLPMLNESIVRCRPVSGKMHQIRVHLRNLGFPISNDPLFSPETAVNREKNRIEQELYERIFADWPCLRSAEPGPFSPSSVEMADVPDHIDVSSYVVENMRERISRMAELRLSTVYETEKCTDCGRDVHTGVPDSGLFLHAYRLEHDGEFSFSFHTELPAWCEWEEEETETQERSIT